MRAAFLTSAGYGEAGEEGKRHAGRARRPGRRARDPARAARTARASCRRRRRCARRSWRRTRRPAASASPASRGNFVSSFMNYAVQTGVGVSRAVSAGNAAADDRPRLPRLLRRRPRDARRPRLRRGHPRRPRLLRARARRSPSASRSSLLKGGASADGQRAAASHTGSLATDDRVFDGMCRQAGITRAATIEEAYEAAATFATQPLPKGNRVVVMTTAGGWGVVTADAIARSSLELVAAARRPARRRSTRSSRRAGAATTRSTSPAARRATRSPSCSTSSPRIPTSTPSSTSASASSRTRRADARRAASTRTTGSSGSSSTTSARTPGSPRPRPRPADVRQAGAHRHRAGRHRSPTTPVPPRSAPPGRLCYASANRAVTALDHLWRYAQWRGVGGSTAP